MKILFLARETPFPADSGVKMRAWLVLKSLAKTHEVSLICFGSEGSGLHPELQTVCKQVHAVAPLAKGARRPYGKMLLGLLSSDPFAIRGRYSERYDQKVKEVLKNEGIGLIVCDSLYQAQYVPEGEFKLLLNEHNIESVIIGRYAGVEKNPLKAAYARYECNRMKQYEKSVWGRFKKILVCSDVDKREVKKRCPDAYVEVIPNGVNAPAAVENNEDSDTLVYTGLIGWHPNEDAVLYFAESIFPLIKKERPSVQWSIVGKDPSVRVQALTKDRSISVTGFVEDINAYITTGAVIVVPLRIGSGTRLKILEAMSMKKAVVSTSIGCEGLRVSHGTDIMIADTPEAFASNVLELLNNEERRNELGRNARALVENEYTYPVIGKKIEEVLVDL